ncbi:hypothetical protein EW146_g6185 [Bondarzewia mesenterica]|uniref:Uncharacterized protein n=1 Tax=Bondarzewia mesenterica TaxID=1095465 RepID=A0A4S4LPD2_9AGAM|nr:hypothetical protein EW146_g6185 [Bondarzewia mesenterica]
MPKAKLEKPSAFSEPSEPSNLSPEDEPREQITGEQEENPQLVLKNDKRDLDNQGKAKGVKGKQGKQRAKM